IDVLVDLRSKHTSDGSSYGVDVLQGKVTDMEEIGVLEPARVKKQAIASATETARLILRIDDIISGKGTSSAGAPGEMGGGPGGFE
ncbi:MAG: thermosome subunit, partial [Bdellovibrio sp.]